MVTPISRDTLPSAHLWYDIVHFVAIFNGFSRLGSTAELIPVVRGVERVKERL